MPRYCSAISSSLVRLHPLRSPSIGANLQVQPFGGGFGQPVGQRLEHDRRVVVVGGFEGGDALFDAVAGGDGKGADVVVFADKIGQRHVVAAFRLLVLLAQADPAGQLGGPGFVA
jgi:hypothetical protein